LARVEFLSVRLVEPRPKLHQSLYATVCEVLAETAG